jgi:hypothetical protein
MSRRPALATQADISRAIRAAQECGLPIAGVVVRSDGFYIETEAGKLMPVDLHQVEPKRGIVL